MKTPYEEGREATSKALEDSEPDYTEVYKGAVDSLRKDLESNMEAFDKRLQDRLLVMSDNQDTITQHLKDATEQFKFLKESYETLYDTVETVRNTAAWLRERLAMVLPEPNNCSKCGAKLIKASKKCVCGQQN